LVQAGWLAALLGCLHYDLGQRELAEAARQGAWQFGRQTGHGELMGWACEMACWFAITEGRFEDVLEFAHKGQAVAGTSSAMVQLTLQEAKAYARMGPSFAQEARDALENGAHILGQLPTPSRPEHHFVFDHTKWIYYASTVYTWQGDNDRAEEHANEIITRHTRANGSTDSPMRVAGARIDLALLNARRRDLDGAVEQGLMAFEYDRRSLADLVARGNELADELTEHFPDEPLAGQYQERLHVAHQALTQQRPELLA
jgi:tetratricopeptide (TPR) repeat protein